MGYKVYVGQMYKAEIDFVAEKADSVAYVQVTYLLASEETVEREFGNLKLIKDSHPKYVISMDRLYLTELLSLQGVWDKTWET